MTVINANRLIMGRLASIVAQKLLAGEEISIVNAENAIISGSKIKTIEDYVKFQEIGTREWGPYFPKRPDRILKRTVRGMLPYKSKRGKDALSNLKVYVGIPVELKDSELVTFDEASITRLSSNKYVKLGDVSKRLGSKY